MRKPVSVGCWTQGDAGGGGQGPLCCQLPESLCASDHGSPRQRSQLPATLPAPQNSGLSYAAETWPDTTVPSVKQELARVICMAGLWSQQTPPVFHLTLCSFFRTLSGTYFLRDVSSNPIGSSLHSTNIYRINNIY